MKKCFLKLACSTLLLGLSVTAIAENTEDYTLKRAKEGEASSQTALASRLCEEGNYREGLYWWEQAAKQNDSWAIYRLANAYYEGNCSYSSSKQFPPDYRLALEWYEKALFKDNISNRYDAQFHIAEIYYFGKGGVEKNVILAKSHYNELANITDAEIQNNDIVEEIRGNARYRLA